MEETGDKWFNKEQSLAEAGSTSCQVIFVVVIFIKTEIYLTDTRLCDQHWYE